MRRLAIVGAAAVLGSAAGVGVAMAEGSSRGYRTAVAVEGSAVRTMTVSGTVQPVDQAQVSFQVPGTVDAVAVSVGQQVAAGQTLATLDTTSFDQQVSLDQANLTTAEAKLAQDESGTTLTVVTTGSTSGSVTHAQAGVVGAQHKADLEVQAAAAALASAATACATPSPGQQGHRQTTASSSTTTTVPATSTTTTATAAPAAPGASGCTSALQHAYAAQSQVSHDQQAVQSAEQVLSQALTTEATSARSPTATSGEASDSAAQLAIDQASIDTDQASLVTVQQALESATLTAPIGGTVAVIDLSAGEAVAANSSSRFITIADRGSFETVSSLTTTEVGEVSTGDTAAVTVDGHSGSIAGTVSKIGPVDAGSSGYSYPLVVSLAAGPGSVELAGGSAAEVQIEVARAARGIVVPTPAVHTTAPGRSYVEVVSGGREVHTAVRTGVVGEVYTQITSGLAAGTVVVLADPSRPVPSSSTNSTSRLGGRGGLLGGAGGLQRFVVGARGG